MLVSGKVYRSLTFWSDLHLPEQPLPWPSCPTNFFVYPAKAQTAGSPENGGTLWNFGDEPNLESHHFQVNHVEFRGCFFDSCLRIQRPKGPTKCFFFKDQTSAGCFFAVFVHSDCIIFGYCQHMSNRYKFINIASIMCISMIDNVKLNEHANNASTLYMRM